MTQEDKQALKEFLIGSAVAIITITVIVTSLFFTLNSSPPEDQRFMIVDEYKGCDVIQYSPSSTATYKYFLDCRK
jgi:hypothetical protein